VNNLVIKWGVFLVLVSIIIGAFGAHYFSSILSPGRMKSLQTGINYQMYMGLALLALGNLESKFSSKSYRTGFLLILIGCLLFSLSIYGLVYLGYHKISTGTSILGPTTPIGGLLMILGWLWLLINMIKRN